MWQGLQAIIDYKKKTSHVTDTDVLLPDKLITLDFLTGCPQVVKVGNISTSLILITGDPQGWVLSPLLYFLFTHDCRRRNSSGLDYQQ